MKIIKCKCGKDILVDDHNFEIVNSTTLTCTGDKLFYSVETTKGTLSLNVAHLIKVTPDGMFPDHKDGNYHNNQESNIRVATRSQNNANRKLGKNNTTGYKGTYYYSLRDVWYAFIKVNGKRIHLGKFNSNEEAARAYDVAALKHFGEFANLNFP